MISYWYTNKLKLNKIKKKKKTNFKHIYFTLVKHAWNFSMYILPCNSASLFNGKVVLWCQTINILTAQFNSVVLFSTHLLTVYEDFCKINSQMSWRKIKFLGHMIFTHKISKNILKLPFNIKTSHLACHMISWANNWINLILQINQSDVIYPYSKALEQQLFTKKFLDSWTKNNQLY